MNDGNEKRIMQFVNVINIPRLVPNYNIFLSDIFQYIDGISNKSLSNYLSCNN